MKRVLALALLLAATPAWADVMAVGSGESHWVAGGPAQPERVSRENAAWLTAVAGTAGPERFRARIGELAARYDLSPALLEAVVWQESRWNPAARSPAGAQGLAQLMPGTARTMGVDALDPLANLEGGARYLRLQLDSFGGDLEKALAAYNAGPLRVARAGGIPRIAETRAYVAAIMARLAAGGAR